MVNYLDSPSLKKRSHERDLYSFKQLDPVFRGQELAKLNAADARGYIAKRQADGVSPATINKEIGMFSAALNWARLELEWNVPNPFQSRRLDEPPGRDRWLKPEEAEALIRAAKDLPRAGHTVDFILLGLYAGLRPGEILDLEWNRVDLSRKVYAHMSPESLREAAAVLDREVVSRSDFTLPEILREISGK